MVQHDSWTWSLAAAILMWLAAILNALEMILYGPSVLDLIPGVCLAVSGLLFLVVAIRQRGQAR